ncbi:GDT1-like protein 5 [Dichanthelium oligosanthes]|uniref:GDT1 family protein n=1 Tax=Dichanthelium oligosanthes TaxID=888268 RepID=A0A1E5URF7_9POAL|nr:GDT1-like protein 5 [Dichanthelium oligosanthes]
MAPSLLGGFTKSLAMTVLSEIGDKTFFAAADAAFKSNKGESKNKSKANEDTKKQQRPFLMQFFSPIFIKAFSITFFGEWGDKSQIATIGLAADENPFGVVLGGIMHYCLCPVKCEMSNI